jgi:23S rRNA U2552 (ribose-2'-O)-methylase RlmE/FtsJ
MRTYQSSASYLQLARRNLRSIPMIYVDIYDCDLQLTVNMLPDTLRSHRVHELLLM